ncbi:recombinase family protein [Streptomyces sp. ME19-01-6]|uniref:recombinase family protein n=1 Tax=Streptomyces sp. ME19-01-6 TaxID=3028686 RepID=UPI0029BBB13E|nr:recombinase family protein [Streptomyces sp. ME19-01-6]MDX3231602.1 recombinase family protein [Streptomyces sp. ME19-01-6]
MDPGTADGRLMLQVAGAMAAFERSLIKERTRAGLDAAKAQGRTGGLVPDRHRERRTDTPA